MQVYNLEKKYDDSLEAFMRKIFFRVGILWLGLLIAIVAIGLGGCSRIHIVCPLGTVGVMQSGNNVGTGLIAAATSAAKIAGFAARGPGAPSSTGPVALDPTLTTIDYTTVPFFGAEQEACLQPAPPASAPAPIPVNVNATLQLPPGTTVTSAPRVVGQSIEEREK